MFRHTFVVVVFLCFSVKASAQSDRLASPREAALRASVVQISPEVDGTALHNVEPADSSNEERRDQRVAVTPTVSGDLFVNTNLPVSVGVGGRLTILGHFFVQAGMGVTPRGYGNALAGMAATWGASESFTATVTEAFSGALSVNAAAGVQLGRHFDLGVHYLWLRSDVELSPEDVDRAVGQSLPWGSVSTATLHSRAHGVGGEIGFRIRATEQLFFRISLGATYLASADISLDVPTPMREASTAVSDAEAAVEDNITTYGIIPYAGLSIGLTIP